MKTTMKTTRIQVTLKGYKHGVYYFDAHLWERTERILYKILKDSMTGFDEPYEDVVAYPFEPRISAKKQQIYASLMDSELPMTNGELIRHYARKIFRLPARQTTTTVLVSPHVDKEAREQFRHERYHFVLDFIRVHSNIDIQTFMNEARKEIESGEITMRFFYESDTTI